MGVLYFTTPDFRRSIFRPTKERNLSSLAHDKHFLQFLGDKTHSFCPKRDTEEHPSKVTNFS